MLPLPVILGFFSHPAMLAWLVAAGVPLVIHLLNKRKHREVTWAAMQYLLAALRKSSRRMLIEQWLLLAVRMLLIVLLVMALAEPLLEQAGMSFVSGQRTHKVLVIDGSYSMAYKPADKSHFDRAKELAARIVHESSQGDGFTLVLMASPPRVVVGTPAFEPTDFLEEIDHLSLLHGGADLLATLTKVDDILKRARREHARLTREEVIFLTDLGRSTWKPDPPGADGIAEFRQRSERLGSSAALVVADLGQPGAENLALASLRALEPYATLGRDITLEAEIHNFGRQARTRHLVELLVDGRRAGEDYVNLEPGGSATAAFTYRFDTAGEHQVEARLAGDLLDVDNHRWLSLPVKSHLRVLCVNGKPLGDFQGATDYLSVALSPYGEVSERATVRPEVVPESALVQLELDQYDCVFLANVGQFTSSEARILESYVKEGGGLVFFLGDQVRPESYNRQLTPSAAGGANVLPARLGDKVALESPLHFDPLGYRHLLAAPFKGSERSGLLTTPIYQYYQLQVREEVAAQVALGFEGGDAAVVEAPIGRGRSIVVATSADASWTTMPLWTSYVPIVQELLATAVRGQVEQRNLVVGQPLGGPLRTFASDMAVTLETPAGEKEPLRLETDGDTSRWSHADTSQSGFYQVAFASPVSKEESYAVNLDTAESDLSRLDLAELKSDVWSGVPFDPFNWQNPSEMPTSPVVRRESLHQWLLVGVLGLLLTESLLACYFGRRTA